MIRNMSVHWIIVDYRNLLIYIIDCNGEVQNNDNVNDYYRQMIILEMSLPNILAGKICTDAVENCLTQWWSPELKFNANLYCLSRAILFNHKSALSSLLLANIRLFILHKDNRKTYFHFQNFILDLNSNFIISRYLILNNLSLV